MIDSGSMALEEHSNKDTQLEVIQTTILRYHILFSEWKNSVEIKFKNAELDVFEEHQLNDQMINWFQVVVIVVILSSLLGIHDYPI